MSLYSFTLWAQTQTLMYLTEKVSFKFEGQEYTSFVLIMGSTGQTALLVDQDKDPILMSSIRNAKVSEVVSSSVAKMIHITFALPVLPIDSISKMDFNSFQSGKVKALKIKANTEGLLFLLKKFW